MAPRRAFAPVLALFLTLLAGPAAAERTSMAAESFPFCRCVDYKINNSPYLVELSNSTTVPEGTALTFTLVANSMPPVASSVDCRDILTKSLDKIAFQAVQSCKDSAVNVRINGEDVSSSARWADHGSDSLLKLTRLKARLDLQDTVGTTISMTFPLIPPFPLWPDNPLAPGIPRFSQPSAPSWAPPPPPRSTPLPPGPEVPQLMAFDTTMDVIADSLANFRATFRGSVAYFMGLSLSDITVGSVRAGSVLVLFSIRFPDGFSLELVDESIRRLKDAPPDAVFPEMFLKRYGISKTILFAPPAPPSPRPPRPPSPSALMDNLASVAMDDLASVANAAEVTEKARDKGGGGGWRVPTLPPLQWLAAPPWLCWQPRVRRCSGPS